MADKGGKANTVERNTTAHHQRRDMGGGHWGRDVTKCKQTDQQSDIYLVCGDTKLDLTVPPTSHTIGNVPSIAG